jgi:lysyl-tRNA synthetase class 2
MAYNILTLPQAVAIIAFVTRKRLALLRRRSEVLHLIRLFFRRLGFLEVDTPLLAPALIPESSLEVFRTAGDPELYLIPSPELWMKRLLAEGSGSLFQLCRCFRNHEPESPLHSREFTMLEWYAVEADYLESIGILERLFGFLLERMGLGPALRFRGRRLDCAPPFPRLSMREAFRRQLGWRLEDLQDLKTLARKARALEVQVAEDDSWADLFHKVFLSFVEPALPADRPLVLLDYPAAVPTLARRSGCWAERWELYLGGIEVANCYSEATNAPAIEQFFRGQSEAKLRSWEPHRVDWELAAALQASLPRCSGAALGVDRLLMVLLDEESVAAVSAIP